VPYDLFHIVSYRIVKARDVINAYATATAQQEMMIID